MITKWFRERGGVTLTLRQTDELCVNGIVYDVIDAEVPGNKGLGPDKVTTQYLVDKGFEQVSKD